MAENRAQSAEELSLMTINWMESRYFSNAFASSRGLRKQLLEDVKQKYNQEQIRLRSVEKAEAQAKLAEEGSQKQVKKAKTLMNAGQYMEAQMLLDDNVIPSFEVNELRTDCELGVEYEKIDKKNYLKQQLQAAFPETMKMFQGEKKRTERKFGFGSYKVKWRLILPILMAAGYILMFLTSKLGFGILGFLDSLSMMLAPTATIGFIVIWIMVARNDEIASFKRKLIWAAMIVGVILMFMASGNGNGTFVGLYLMAVTGISFWISLNDYKSLTNTDMEKLYKIYAKELLPVEDKLIQEYQNRFQKLSEYAPLDELTTVWEDYMQRMK